MYFPPCLLRAGRRHESVFVVDSPGGSHTSTPLDRRSLFRWYFGSLPSDSPPLETLFPKSRTFLLPSSSPAEIHSLSSLVLVERLFLRQSSELTGAPCALLRILWPEPFVRTWDSAVLLLRSCPMFGPVFLLPFSGLSLTPVWAVLQ